MAVLIKQEISEAQSVSVSLPLILKQSIFAALAIVVGLSLIGTQTTAPSVNEIAHAETPQTSEPINIPPEPVETPVEPVNAVTWQDNPNQCNTETQYIAAEAPFNCIDKKVTIQNKVSTPSGIQWNGSANCEMYRSLVSQYDWNVDVAMAVMRAESGCNPNAANLRDRHANCTGSFGLFQLACFWTSTPYDPAHNVAKAYEIYSRSGWKPWGAYTNQSYLKYL